MLVKEQGFKTMMSAFNGQRCLNAAISLGQARGAFEEAVAYVDNRRQFGQRLSDFQGIQWMLADMAIELDAARLLIYRAASNAGAGLPDLTEAAMAKTFANEVAIRVSNQAMQLFGGHGYLKSMPGRTLRARRPLRRAGRRNPANPAQPDRQVATRPPAPHSTTEPRTVSPPVPRELAKLCDDEGAGPRSWRR